MESRRADSHSAEFAILLAEAHYQLGNALSLLGRSEEAVKEGNISASIQTKQAANYGKKLRGQQ